MSILLYLYIVHVYLTCNFHVHKFPPGPKSKTTSRRFYSRGKNGFLTQALDGYKVAIFAYGQTGREGKGCRMDGFSPGNLLPLNFNSEFLHPGNTWVFLSWLVGLDEFPLKGKGDY